MTSRVIRGSSLVHLYRVFMCAKRTIHLFIYALFIIYLIYRAFSAHLSGIYSFIQSI